MAAKLPESIYVKTKQKKSYVRSFAETEFANAAEKLANLERALNSAAKEI